MVSEAEHKKNRGGKWKGIEEEVTLWDVRCSNRVPFALRGVYVFFRSDKN